MDKLVEIQILLNQVAIMTFLANENKESNLTPKMLDYADKTGDLVLKLIKNEKLKCGIIETEIEKFNS